MRLERDLADFRAEFDRRAPAGWAALYDAEIDELRASFPLGKVVAIGDTAPNFALPDVHGEMIALHEALGRGPAILALSAGPPMTLPSWKLRKSLSGFGWAALSVTSFSGWFVVARLSVTHDLRVWDVMALRFGGGALILFPVLFGRGPRLPSRAWLEGLLLASLWGAPFVFFVALGLQLTSAAQASAITPALMPVFAGLIGWLSLRESPGGLRLVGYIVIVGGLAALIIGAAPSHGRPSLGGIASLIVAAAMWGKYTPRFRQSGPTPLQAAAMICFWSALLYLPPYLWFGLSHLDHASVQELMFHVVYQGFLMSVVAVVAFNRAVTLLGPGAGTAIIALLPVIVAALAVPVLGEIPPEVSAVAIGAIAVGVLLAARPAPSQKPSQTHPSTGETS